MTIIISSKRTTNPPADSEPLIFPVLYELVIVQLPLTTTSEPQIPPLH